MDFGLLAFLTNIEVVANRAHVADSCNRTLVTNVADDSLVNNFGLGSLLLSDAINKHASELVSTVALDFTSHSIESSFKKLALESSTTTALFARLGSFLVHL